MTFHDLKWPWPLATWRGVTGRNIPSLGVTYTCNPLFERVLNGFLPKEAPLIFLPLTLGEGEVAKLTWPRVTDIKIPRYIFYRSWYGYQSLKVSRWSGFGVAMTSLQTFSEVRSLNVTWWPDLEWPGSEVFTLCAKKMYEQVYQKRRRVAPPFF